MEKYEMGSADALFQRIDNDETGELKSIIMQLIELCKRTAQLEVPMNELATCCTLAWYMGQSPEIESIFKTMMKSKTIDKNNIN